MRWQRWRAVYVQLFALLLASSAVVAVRAQSDDQPGVRGTLYESPSFGWILIAPPGWTFADAQSADGIDAVHLVADAADGADEYVVSYRDEGAGVDGCVHGLVDSLAATYSEFPLAGWREPAVEFPSYSDDQSAIAYARIVRDQGAGLDLMAVVTCRAQPDSPLLIAEVLLRTERDLEGDVILPTLAPLWPGQTHTGRPRAGETLAGGVSDGVVRFFARSFPPDADGYAFPFSCLDQESFPRPVEPPPPNKGWFVCDGKIVNVDIVPATIDLERIVIGCESGSAEASLPGCPEEPVALSSYDILDATATVDGSVLTLAPGEYADVVLWYALPGGEPPSTLFYAEPDRLVLVGSTFFTEGTGSRIPVIIGR